MTRFSTFWAVMMPISTMLAGCSGAADTVQERAPSEAANHYYLNDISSSTATQLDPVVAKAVEKFIGDDMNQNLQLGDAVMVYDTGAAAAERMVATVNLVTDYNLRVPAAKAKVMAGLHASAARFQADKGDGGTNLLLSIGAIRPKCTPRSTVTFITDGLEESVSYSTTNALNAGQAVNLPPPANPKLLAGCKIRMVGVGMTADAFSSKAQVLPEKQRAMLELGWMRYLTQAGVRPEDVEFVSTL